MGSNRAQKNPDQYFADLGPNFEKFMSNYDVSRRVRLIKTLTRSVPRDSKVLEVGCGTGAITKEFKEDFADYTATDVSEKLAEAVVNKYGVKGKAIDATSMDLPSNEFDLVLSSECIEHTKDPLQALREMIRVVKPGGHLIVTSPNRLWLPSLWIATHLGMRNFDGLENWIWPLDAQSFLRQNGCVIAEASGCHLFPWQVPFAKSVLPFFDQIAPHLYFLMVNWGIHAIKVQHHGNVQELATGQV